MAVVCLDFDSMVLEARNTLKAVIYSSHALDKKQTATITADLTQKLGRNIQADVVVQPDLMGGLKVRLKDKTYDYSLKAQLEEFRSNFERFV